MKFINLYRKYEREILLLLVVLLWALCYFSINNFTEGRKTHILAFSFEKSIPFVPAFIFFYILTYVSVMIPYFIIRDKMDYRRAVLAYLFIIFVSSIIYLIYPVETIRPDIESNGFFLSIVAWVYSTAKPYNLFPSLHISLSTLSALVSLKYKRIVGYILIILLLFISLSTLFVKQHYLVDIIFATVLAFFSYYLFLFKKAVV